MAAALSPCIMTMSFVVCACVKKICVDQMAVFIRVIDFLLLMLHWTGHVGGC